MSLDWTVYASLTLGLASALVAGVFQSFSDFVMRGLVAAAPQGGAQSMQMINRTVMRSVFLVMLLGLTPATLAFAAYAWFAIEGPAQGLIIAGAGVYAVSVFIVTMAGNVPMNNRLDAMDHTAFETAGYWRTYGKIWTRWNHVRTLGSLATAILFILAGVALA